MDASRSNEQRPHKSNSLPNQTSNTFVNTDDDRIFMTFDSELFTL